MESTYETALKAIIARVEQRFDDKALDPYRGLICSEDDGAEWCAVDCKTIAHYALNAGK